MSIYNLTNATTPDGILVGVSTSVPVFPIMLLVFVWFVRGHSSCLINATIKISAARSY